MTRRFSPNSQQSKSNLTRHLGAAFLCLLVLGVAVSGARASSAEAPAVENVVVAGESGALTVEITTSAPQPPEFQTYIYQRPDRLIIDLGGFVWKQGRTAHLSAGRAGVDTIRVGQHRSDPPSTRIVFDLSVSPDQLSYETIETAHSGRLVFEFAAVAGVAAPQPAPVAPVAPTFVAPEPEEEAGTAPAPQEAMPLEPEQETAIAAAMAAAPPPPPAAVSVSNPRKIIGWVLIGVAVALLIAARWRWFCDLAFGRKPRAAVVETAPADAVEPEEEEFAEEFEVVVAGSEEEPLPIEEVRPETKELPMVAVEEVEASEAKSPVAEEDTAEPVVELPVAEEAPVAEETPAQPVEILPVAVSPPSPAALVGELPEADPNTRMAVLARLKERMSEEHGLLLPFLKDSNPKVRAAVAEAVGELRAAEYAGALAAALGDPDREVRISVLRAFQGLGEAASYYVDYVRSRLADPD
ncbi:MAG: HEAT repeat domain-containing protein, partial [Proteobacteria bacterium]|nr:HEAT repeat domain-containing protein [Pseudomonadota bacterium]